MAAFLVCLCLMGYALGQTATSDVLQTTMKGSATPAPTSDIPTTVSLFLPIIAENLVASVISAGINSTAYALGCLPNTDAAPEATNCTLAEPMTITQGLSTLIYTNTPRPDTALANEGATLFCNLTGATSAISPSLSSSPTTFVPATSAVCLVQSAITGLGESASTSVLARDEIRYVPVTVTAGGEKLVSAASAAASESRAKAAAASRGGAAVPGVTAMARVGAMGVGVGMVVLGVL